MRCYLVCYDIRDHKRLYSVHKVMKGYGEPWQYSVFFCRLKNTDRIRMEACLTEEMNLKEDQALIMDLGPSEKAVRESIRILGKALPEEPGGLVFV
jgi:CRISPR-associated protein Cas2